MDGPKKESHSLRQCPFAAVFVSYKAVVHSQFQSDTAQLKPTKSEIYLFIFSQKAQAFSLEKQQKSDTIFSPDHRYGFCNPEPAPATSGARSGSFSAAGKTFYHL